MPLGVKGLQRSGASASRPLPMHVVLEYFAAGGGEVGPNDVGEVLGAGVEGLGDDNPLNRPPPCSEALPRGFLGTS